MSTQKIKKQSFGLKNKQITKGVLPSFNQTPDNQQRFILFGILIITAIVYANSLGNNFIENYDDNKYIIDNNLIRHLNWNNLKILFSTFYLSNYHPFTLLSYAIEYKFFGLNPFVFHLTNYILHLANTLLVYLFLKRFTGKFLVAAIASLFFGIHPMHVESVAWIAERKDMLYTFFFLLSLNSYVKYMTNGNKKSCLVWAFIWFLLSLLSKSAAICLPLVLLLIDYYCNKEISWNTLIRKIPFFILSLFFGIFAIFSQYSTIQISPSFGILDRIFLVSHSLIFYLINAFAPFNLSIIHGYPVKLNNLLPIEYYLDFPLLLLLIWGVYKAGNFKRELLLGILFYFITIVFVVQIIPVGRNIVSERYSYVPYIGIFFIFGQFLSHVKENKFTFSNRIKYSVPFILILLFSLFSFLTYQRNKVWKNGEVLFTDAMNKAPQDGFIWYALGNSKYDKGDYNAALFDFNKSEMLGYNDKDLYYNRGILKDNADDFKSAVADYTKAIEVAPAYIPPYYNRGLSYYKSGDFTNAIIDFTHLLKLNPNDTLAHSARGFVELDMRDYANAVADFSKDIEINPNTPKYYFQRANAKYGLKDYRGTLLDINKGLEYIPNDPGALFRRGAAKYYLNEKDSACKDWILAQKYGSTQASSALNTFCK